MYPKIVQHLSAFMYFNVIAAKYVYSQQENPYMCLIIPLDNTSNQTVQYVRADSIILLVTYSLSCSISI